MKKIKVVQIGGNTQKNGITTYLINTYKHLYPRFQFIFINTAYREPNKEIEHTIKQLGGKIYHLPYSGDFDDIEEDYFNILKNEMPDVVHAHYFFSNGDFLRIADKALVPIRISHCHNDKSKYLTAEQEKVLQRSRKLCDDYATLQLAVSKNAGEFLYGKNNFIVSKMIIDVDKFYKIKNTLTLFEKHNIDPNFNYSIFIGRFSFQKNVFFFIDLLKKFTKRKLIMIGEGPFKESLINKLKENNLAKLVIFKKDMYSNELLNLADSFLLPSLYEGASISLIEAQLAGLHCIASNLMSNDANLGNVHYLGLDVDLWMTNIERLHRKKPKNINKDLLMPKNIAIEYQNYYTDYSNLSEKYVTLAKEFKIGSSRVFNSWEKAVYYFKRAHDLKNIKGTFYLALQYFEGLGVNKDLSKADDLINKILPAIENRVKQNKVDYILILADCYSFGLGKLKNLEKAAYYYKKASEMGSSEAMCSLAYMFEVGSGVEKNLKTAFTLYKKSAELDYLHSMRDLGLCYLHGIGTEKSYLKALPWLRKASANNYGHATTDLAHCYLTGKGVMKDIDESIHLYKLALKQDESRTKRDLIAHSISVDTLINENRIKIITKEALTNPNDIDNNVLVGKTIIINKHIKTIEPNIFYENKTINKFFVEKDNAYFHSYAGVLYSKDLEKLVRFPLASEIKSFIVPDHVKIIGNSAFDDCINLKEIKMHKNIKEIHDWAFHGCDNLVEINIPEGVNKIGQYAFGSCESLTSINVHPNNSYFKDIDGNLYTHDNEIFLQYAIGKKEKLFVMPNKTKSIAFRAFSDAYKLEYIDLKNVMSIDEKAFYWCVNLQTVIMHKDCIVNGTSVFKNTSRNLVIKHNTLKRMILLSDIHGHLRLPFIKSKLNELNVNKDDIVVILGDAGMVWDDPMNPDVKSYYQKLSFDVYFIDGNHENFDLLKTMNLINKNGNKVHKVLDNVFHLRRGVSYILCGHKIFTFGGAYSIKRENNTSPVRVWEEELPNTDDYKRAISTIKENHYKFDYIFTHQGPKNILDNINYTYEQKEHDLLHFLEYLSNTLSFNKWYFGHIHKDITINQYTSLYNDCVVINYDE